MKYHDRSKALSAFVRLKDGDLVSFGYCLSGLETEEILADVRSDGRDALYEGDPLFGTLRHRDTEAHR